MKPDKRRSRILGVIQIFVAINALPAGLALGLTPDGSRLGLALERLSGTPFPDYFIPGIVLFVANGLLNVVGAVLSFRRSRHTAIFGIGLGVFLSLWVIVQVYFIGLIHFLQPLFLAIGILEIALAYRLRQSA